MSGIEAEKALAGERAVDEIRDGMMVGLGTGSTAAYAIREIGRRVANGLKIVATATSTASEQLAASRGIALRPFDEISQVDLTIDGADEIDNGLIAIKGGGGALLREKVVAAASKRMIVIADSSKLVNTLGKFPLPIEVLPFASGFVDRTLRDLGIAATKRTRADGSVYQTDQGAYIFDAALGRIDAPAALAARLKEIPGVLEHGLFLSEIDAAYIARGGEITIIHRGAATRG